jgi:RNA polymerase sigma-70 factor (ECF subfamily)
VHTGDSDDADDVAQEVLVRLCTRLHSYSGRSRFTTWLYQVTRNTALGLSRRIASRVRLAGLMGGRAAVEGRRLDDPMERVQSSQLGEIVMALFQGLPLRQRQVFHLAEVEGLAATEVAERLGMNPVTVRAHLFRARRALRARILARHPELAEDRES